MPTLRRALTLIALLLAGCAAAPPATPSAPLPTQTALPTASATPLPSPTPSPSPLPTLTSEPSATPEPLAPETYCLWPGDTLAWVASQAQVSLSDLEAANPHATRFAGSTLRLPPGALPPAQWSAPLPAVRGIDDLPASDSGIYLSFNNRRKWISLTFDVGYEPGNLAMETWLAEQGIHATFFVVGESVLSHPEMIRDILSNGHSLGNHSWHHPNLTHLASEDILTQFARTENAVQAADPGATTLPFFRAPFGAVNDNVLAVARYAGYHVIGWTVDSHDWMDGVSADQVSERVTQNACPGAIIEMHDVNPANSAALPRIVAFLKRNGYEFVDLKTLLTP
jgi:peptidoglycan/xylan/chitin deacetylase (PgdA/CDA1 family)